MKSISMWVAVSTVLFASGFPLRAPVYAAMVIGDNVTVVREGGSMNASFYATSGRDGSASGQIHLYDATPLIDQDVDGTGDSALVESPAGVATQAVVNCLVVDGSTAIVGGKVTHSNVKRYLGKQVLLFVEDGAGGRISWGFYEPQQAVSCDNYPRDTYTPQKIAAGKLQVRR
jgi:hypothetical protein